MSHPSPPPTFLSPQKLVLHPSCASFHCIVAHIHIPLFLSTHIITYASFLPQSAILLCSYSRCHSCWFIIPLTSAVFHLASTEFSHKRIHSFPDDLSCLLNLKKHKTFPKKICFRLKNKVKNCIVNLFMSLRNTKVHFFSEFLIPVLLSLTFQRVHWRLHQVYVYSAINLSWQALLSLLYTV